MYNQLKNDYTKKELDAWEEIYYQKWQRIEEELVEPAINSMLKIVREKSLMDHETVYLYEPSNEELKKALLEIQEKAFSPVNDDWIWMDDALH